MRWIWIQPLRKEFDLDEKRNMSELNDYSGEFNPDLKFADFSKDFLLELLKNWQWAWMHMDHAFFEQFILRNELAEAFDMDMAGWLRVATRINPLFAEVGKIPMENVVDCHKALQLPLDNTMGEMWSTSIEFINEYETVHDVNECPALSWIEDHAPERITGLCKLDRQVIERYKISMDVELSPVKLPPRQSKDEKPCAWRLRKEIPEGRLLRSLDELVNLTDCPPEVDDLSGPLYPNLKHEHFSKNFLIRLIDTWQYAWFTMAETHFLTARKKHGYDEAMEITRAAWRKSMPGIHTRYANTARIALDTLADSMKMMQLGLDSTISPLYRADYKLLDDNRAIISISKRDTLTYPDWPAPDLTIAMTAGDWTERIQLALLNPAIQVRALDAVPMPGDRRLSCRWEVAL